MSKKLLFAVLALFISVTISRAEIVDQIVAIVNDETITYQEMRKVLTPIYAQYQRVYEGEELLDKMVKAKNEVLNQLIENKLLAQEARSRGMQIDSKEIEDHIDKIRARFKTVDEFERVMAAEGMGLSELTRSVEDQYLVRALVQRELAPRALVGPADVETYYQEHLEDFKEEEMVHAGHILVKKTGQGDAVASAEPVIEAGDIAFAKIKEAEQALGSGEDFESVAKRYSEAPNAEQGGDLGFFTHGTMMKELEEAAFAIPVGDTGAIIESPVGYHLITVKAKRAARTIPLPDVKKKIESELFQTKTDGLRTMYVKNLRKKAFVKILE